MEIRAERPGDEAAIAAVTEAAFRTAAVSSGTEAAIVEGLRSSGALAVSLVAVAADGIAGHVAASPATVGGEAGWMAIGPVSVLPAWQRQGIGAALMTAALDALREAGASGAVLVGDPAYYGRFGFGTWPRLGVPGIPGEYVLALPFGPAVPEGEIAFHPAFGVAS